jgi:peptide/nickel transport system permease protein
VITRADVPRLATNLALVLGITGVLALTFVALFGSRLTESDPQAQRIVLFYPDGDFKIPPSPPDALHLLGTDPLGRDQLARILWGARLTFTVVLLALGVRTALSLLFGISSGWRRGIVEQAVTVITNAVAGVPQLLLALLIAILLRDKAIIGFVIALGCVGWAEGAQFVRVEVERIRAAPYIEAATAIGGRTPEILTRHVLRGLAPQLFGLIALEAGATLLLLAELGFLGVFMSGFIVSVDDNNRPILPVRDRAPEWGQMLAGATQYAFSNQYVAFVPGVFVAGAVFVFNLLGEGLRSASDPFSELALSPKALGALGRGLFAFALVSGATLGVIEARTTQLSFDDAMGLAREAADRFEPGNQLIGGVVELRSDAHALARPAKFNFYFHKPPSSAILRVGFPDADQNAMEQKKFSDDDGLLYDLMTGPSDVKVSWNDALAKAEAQGGSAYRSGARTWLVRVVLTARDGIPFPYWRVMYSGGSTIGAPTVDVVIDARSGDTDTPAMRPVALRLRAEGLLSGEVVQTAASAVWRSTAAPASQRGFGTERPVSQGGSFVRSDLPADLRVAFVGTGPTGGSNVGTASTRPAPLSRSVDVERAFAAAEAAGGRDVRAGLDDWSASVNANMQNGTLVVNVFYSVPNRGQVALFSYDPVIDKATRLS